MCAWIFGDSFDLYAAVGDMTAGYWDGGTTTNIALNAGRFSGGQCIQFPLSTIAGPFKNSTATTDPVHHIVCAFRQTGALGGTTLGAYFQLSDGATNQCCVVFRTDGAILLTSATPAGTVLDTYTGAVTANATWFAFEFEVVINASTGSWAVTRNGSTSNDHSLGSLNTRPGANTQANKLTIGLQTTVNAHQLDDILWRSDASAVPWVGDIRCYTRMPASDVGTPQFSRSPSSATQTPFAHSVGANMTAGTARYTPFTAAYDGTIGTATVSLSIGYTGNLKATIFASSGGVPTTVLGSATVIVNPATGSSALTFGAPVSVIRGTAYWIGFDSDTSLAAAWDTATGTAGLSSTTAYASFPTASPGTVAAAPVVCSLTITTTTNYEMVNEAQQDGTTSYVYDSTPGDADFYGIGTIASTPVATIAVTTRGFMEKSDAGLRTAAVQIKSGGTTVASPTATLSSSFGWVWRTDLTDPATGAAWTAVGVNAVNIGPTTVA